ncbi:helix-turn-helix transcriptional regulator [Noviherbaspirillum sp. UKPF54]|uniref:ArsR/SmtB family transcription factor n=1 Tax=Noviherbaspirillum sp. UKPF54 TaxID=2601898 RepID=UPI0011B16602|nr:winged helix-turn-helix domain-containing protein [Noviherbaspirillum sp. UKPF54]QDZ29817.1 winged helix-turn-helix transcriptional regulator [Noviherbaspirillum sp. UKPF54]
MKDGPNIVRIAALIGDHARAEALTALMSGRALTATELADAAAVTKQTMSGHLAKLLDAGLLAVEAQGRHRYYRLADEEVAHLLESLMGVAYLTGAVRLRSSPREPALRQARVCYDHLAGELGVRIYAHLLKMQALVLGSDGLAVTETGRRWFAQIGIDTDALASKRRLFCRTCLDWSERRHHLAGSLGAALFTRCIEQGWARRAADSRVVTLTRAGQLALQELLGEQSR